MIASLLASVGLPMLVKTVKGALGSIKNPVAKAAADALGKVDKAIKDSQISPEQIAEANRHTEKMKELETKENIEALKTVNSTIQAEVKADDKYVRRWRPTFGYAVALSWLIQMTAVAYCIVVDPVTAPQVIAALVSSSVLWTVALGVLGVSVVKRSHDKANARRT